MENGSGCFSGCLIREKSPLLDLLSSTSALLTLHRCGQIAMRALWMRINVAKRAPCVEKVGQFSCFLRSMNQQCWSIHSSTIHAAFSGPATIPSSLYSSASTTIFSHSHPLSSLKSCLNLDDAPPTPPPHPLPPRPHPPNHSPALPTTQSSPRATPPSPPRPSNGTPPPKRRSTSI